MIPQQLSYVAWMSLPVETRQKLVALFVIEKTGESVVHVGAMTGGNISGEHKSDGYTPKDLAIISLEKMQEITGSKNDNFYELFGQLVKDIDDYVESDQVPPSFENDNIAAGLGTVAPEEVVQEAKEKRILAKDGKHAKAKSTKTK